MNMTVGKLFRAILVGMSRSPAKVLVTRSGSQASGLAQRLRELGAEPIPIPAIAFAPPTAFAPLDAALRELSRFHWVVFTSATAVEAFQQRLGLQHGGASAAFPRVAAIGAATASALGQAGYPAALVPPRAVAESLTEALLPFARQPGGAPTRFLVVRAEDAREHLPETLRAAGAEVTVAPAYRTVIPEASVAAIRDLFSTPVTPVDAITFTSGSTAGNLFALFAAAGLPFPGAAVRASIGPVTSAALRELGHPPHVESAEASISALAETLVKYLARREPA